jgi:hypothetical protein
MRHLSDDASIGVITYVFIAVAAIALFYLVTSAIIQPFQLQFADDIARGLPVSGARIETINTLVQGWVILPVMAIIIIFIWAIKQSLAEKDTGI